MKNVNELDPRVKRTRQMLLNALYQLAEEKDVGAISVQEIAERAGLNRATFYAHFSDKEALMDAAFRLRLREALEAKLSPSASLTRANLHLLFRVLCDFLDSVARHCSRSLWDRFPFTTNAVQEELLAFIRDWLNRALPKDRSERYPLETLAGFLSWSLLGASFEWRRNPAKGSQEVLAAEVVDLMTAGLGSAIPSL